MLRFAVEYFIEISSFRGCFGKENYTRFYAPGQVFLHPSTLRRYLAAVPGQDLAVVGGLQAVDDPVKMPGRLAGAL